jgi:Fur family ferric uptake transcriptional regulator
MPTALELARDESLERFKSWLRAQHQPATPQRLAIAAVVLGADKPLAADEVVDRLRSAGPAPGVATVYRTIDLLIAGGLAVEENNREGFRRFVPVRGDVSSDELLCTHCGEVTRVNDRHITERAKALAESSGFVAVRHRLVVYGLCAACQATSHQLPAIS